MSNMARYRAATNFHSGLGRAAGWTRQRRLDLLGGRDGTTHRAQCSLTCNPRGMNAGAWPEPQHPATAPRALILSGVSIAAWLGHKGARRPSL
jgi:hypothetical protein